MNNFEKLKFLFVSVGENTNRLGSVFNTVRGWQVITPANPVARCTATSTNNLH